MKKNQIGSIIIMILIFSSTLLSCSSDDNEEKLLPFSTDPCELIIPTPDSLRFKAIYEMPIIKLAENHIFYSNERMDIVWDLPGDLWNTEIQFIETNAPYSCDDYDKFHQLNNEGFGYGNQFVHYYSSPQSLSYRDTIFVSYRARSTDVKMVKDYSLWTEVKSFIIVPTNDLNKKIISETYNLKFVTEEMDHHYYSGITKFSNYRLIDIANSNNIPYEKIRIVNITGFNITFKTFREDGEIPFERIMIGYDENVNPDETVYPFDVIGDAYPGSFEESPFTGTLYGNLDRNIAPHMINYDLKIAYHLREVEGRQHEFNIYLLFEIYYEN